MELFSPIGAPNEEGGDIDWLSDLKFYIDNDDAMLNQHFFPAVERHKEHKGNPNAYKIYVRPIEQMKDQYCKKFEISDAEDKFPKDSLIELAKRFATEQEQYMDAGDYDASE